MLGTRLALCGTLAAIVGTAGWFQDPKGPTDSCTRPEAAKPLATFDHPGMVGVTVTPDGTKALTWDSGGQVKVWAMPGESLPLLPPLCGLPEDPAIPSSWSPEQACGAPDTLEAGDRPTAWAPHHQDRGAEWLELGYQDPMVAHAVRIRETYNPGAVTAVHLLGEGDELLAEVPVAPGQARTAPSVLEVSFAETTKPVHKVHVILDTARVAGWNEIDAVELVGSEGSRWATSANASSSFAWRR